MIDKKQLFESLEQNLKLFGKVREISLNQKNLIAEDDFEALNESLQKRQDVIDKINGLHRDFAPLMQSYVSFAESGGGATDSEIEKASKKLTELINECAVLNDSNMQMLKDKMKTHSEKSEKMRQSRESLGLYAQGGVNSAELFDKMT